MRWQFYLLILFVVLLIANAVKAQESNNYIGVKGGISIPNLTARGAADNPLNTGYSSRLGPDAVIFYEHAFTPSFSVMPGIEYSSQGGKKGGFQPFPFPEEYAVFFPPGQVPVYLYANFKNEIELNYLMLHVLARYSLPAGASSPFTVYGEAGPFGAYLLSAKDVTSGSSIVYEDAQMQQPLITSAISFDNKMDVKSNVRKGNFGIAGDIGFAYSFSNSRVFIEAGGNYGLLNIQKDAADGKNQTGAVIIRAGYALSFGSRY